MSCFYGGHSSVPLSGIFFLPPTLFWLPAEPSRVPNFIYGRGNWGSCQCYYTCGVVQTCVEAFDLIQASRKHDQDFQKLKLRLNIEKCRLYTWGQAMGFAEPSSDKKPTH